MRAVDILRTIDKGIEVGLDLKLRSGRYAMYVIKKLPVCCPRSRNHRCIERARLETFVKLGVRKDRMKSVLEETSNTLGGLISKNHGLLVSFERTRRTKDITIIATMNHDIPCVKPA